MPSIPRYDALRPMCRCSENDLEIGNDCVNEEPSVFDIRISVTLVVAALSTVGPVPSMADDPVVFEHDIRPLLSDNCFECHGPDEESRQSGLRLDRRQNALTESESVQIAIVPGDPDGSELLRRIESNDADIRMPPVDSGKELTPEQIELIRRWIEQGADWNEHWAFVPPTAATPPRVKNEDRVLNDIDRFVFRRLEREGLNPSPEADRGRLLRRVTLDLTGLPPTATELTAFLADESPDAYERAVDRLLHSPHYGERMALEWMDVARYADTHGYLFDGQRFMWRWRDYVINAFNDNMPFDRFTTEQLAGDLLPNATLDQQIASGFNRNHIINGELGTVPAEFVVENIADRVNTTSTVWMGLTMQCARCHDHKYDPVTQREYYQLYAFFDNTGERGMDGLFNNAEPKIKAPTFEQEQRRSDLDRRLKQINAAMKSLLSDIQAAQSAWEEATRQPFEDVTDGLVSHWTMDGHARDINNGDAGDQAGAGTPFAAGVIGKAAVFAGLNTIKVTNPKPVSADLPFTFSAWIKFSKLLGQRSIMTRMPEGTEPGRGYSFQIHDGRLYLSLVHSYPGSAIEVETETTIPKDQWQQVAATYDGSGKASGVSLYIEGRKQPLHVISDSLSGPIDNKNILEFGDGAPNARAFGQMDDLRVYSRRLSDIEIVNLPGVSLQSLLAVGPADRTPEINTRILRVFLNNVGAPEWRTTWETQQQLLLAQKQLDDEIPTVMVMRELNKPNETRMLMRGAYDQPGDSVHAATPRFLPPMNNELPMDRAGLAQWLTSPNHPLTARVTVNRYWQMYFGNGLVNTAEDFGSQGTPPTHPELLDWLAVRFMETGWDIRELQRLIVTSATYRQSSRVSPEVVARDPENRLLARGPRFRLNAEFIRDQALAVSGLLVNEIGGASVKPYQPDGIWKDGVVDPTGNRWTAQFYRQDSGDKLYRRSMYTYWKRNAPPPTMSLFDAPERERCVVKRNRSNTPLQALALMNDPTFVEASRQLAERMLNEGGSDAESRIQYAFRLLTCRELTEAETQPLLRLYDRQRARFARDPARVESLLNVGESPVDTSLDPVEMAACTAVASVLLNLDETVTRN